jgi:hypothetical protein
MISKMFKFSPLIYKNYYISKTFKFFLVFKILPKSIPYPLKSPLGLDGQMKSCFGSTRKHLSIVTFFRKQISYILILVH